MGVFQLWVRANFPINAYKLRNFISHKLGVLLYRGKEVLTALVERARNFFKLTPSSTPENALLASRNACPRQNLFHYCQIVEFMLVNEFLVLKLERFA